MSAYVNKIKIVSIDSYAYVCRLCLLKNRSLVYMDLDNEQEKEFAIKVQECTTVKLTSDLDGGMIFVCIVCREEIDHFHKFRKKCIDNFKILKNIIGNNSQDYEKEDTEPKIKDVETDTTNNNVIEIEDSDEDDEESFLVPYREESPIIFQELEYQKDEIASENTNSEDSDDDSSTAKNNEDGDSNYDETNSNTESESESKKSRKNVDPDYNQKTKKQKASTTKNSENSDDEETKSNSKSESENKNSFKNVDPDYISKSKTTCELCTGMDIGYSHSQTSLHKNNWKKFWKETPDFSTNSKCKNNLYKCNICVRYFKRADYFENHIKRSEHVNKVKQVRKWYPNKIFNDKQYYNYNVKKVVTIGDKRSKMRFIRNYECQECQRPMSNQSHLVYHMASQHGQGLPKKIICSKCNNSFYNKSHYKYHLKKVCPHRK